MIGTGHEGNIYALSMQLFEVGVIILDPDGKHVFVDDTAARILGRAKEELVGGLFEAGLSLDDKKEVYRSLRRCIETGKALSRRVLKRTVNGRVIYTMGHMAPLWDENGTVTRVLTTIADVTEFVETAQRAHRLGELYRSLVEAVGGVVVRLDRSGKRTFVSDKVEEFLGRSKDETLQGSLGDNMLPEDREMALETLEKTYVTGKLAYGIVTRQMIKGQLRHILTNWVPVFGEDGRVREVQTTLMDITEQVAIRERLRLYSARIRRTQEEERAAISRALHDDTVQVLTAMSHRLDAILAAYDLPEPVVAELEGLANALLDQSDALRRLCMGLRPAMLDRMGLGAALKWLVRRACEGRGIEGMVRVDENLRRLNPSVEIRLFRIAQEAVNNAARHARASKIEVTLEASNGCIRLEVKDDGIGFPATSLLQDDKLGLIGMQERARMLGADLEIQSEPGKGCRISVRGDIEHMEASV